MNSHILPDPSSKIHSVPQTSLSLRLQWCFHWDHQHGFEASPQWSSLAACLFIKWGGFDVHQLENFCRKLNQKFPSMLASCAQSHRGGRRIEVNGLVLKPQLEQGRSHQGTRAGESGTEQWCAYRVAAGGSAPTLLAGWRCCAKLFSNVNLFLKQTYEMFSLACFYVSQAIQTASKDQWKGLVISCNARCLTVVTCSYWAQVVLDHKKWQYAFQQDTSSNPSW